MRRRFLHGILPWNGFSGLGSAIGMVGHGSVARSGRTVVPTVVVGSASAADTIGPDACARLQAPGTCLLRCWCDARVVTKGGARVRAGLDVRVHLHFHDRNKDIRIKQDSELKCHRSSDF